MAFEFFVNNLTFFVFVLILSTFLYVKRENLQISGSFPFLYMMMYRTKLGLDRMDKWSKKHPRTFLYLAYLSVFVGIVGMVFTFVLMFWQLGFIVENDISTGGGLVLPIQTEKGLDSAVPVFYVPFWYWIIALFVLATVHEFAHGVIGERFNVKIKSSGFAFLGILAPIVPAAFVEPDEKSLDKKVWWQKVAVMGAGSTSNFLFGFLFLFVWIFAAGPLIDSTMEVESISFLSVMNESSLSAYSIGAGEVVGFNGVSDKNEILKRIDSLEVGETLSLTIKHSAGENDFDVTTFENPNVAGKGMIGINGVSVDLGTKDEFSYLGSLPVQFERLLFWLWFLNIGIGIMNLLPIWITDGGQISRILLEQKFSRKKALKYNNYISYVSLFLIIFTIWPDFLFAIIGLFS